MAAHRSGHQNDHRPQAEQKDIVDIPKKIQRDLKFVFVERMDDVLSIALAPDSIKSHGQIPKQAQD